MFCTCVFVGNIYYLSWAPGDTLKKIWYIPEIHCIKLNNKTSIPYKNTIKEIKKKQQQWDTGSNTQGVVNFIFLFPFFPLQMYIVLFSFMWLVSSDNYDNFFNIKVKMNGDGRAWWQNLFIRPQEPLLVWPSDHGLPKILKFCYSNNVAHLYISNHLWHS